jgi:hypothetical protein
MCNAWHRQRQQPRTPILLRRDRRCGRTVGPSMMVAASKYRCSCSDMLYQRLQQAYDNPLFHPITVTRYNPAKNAIGRFQVVDSDTTCITNFVFERLDATLSVRWCAFRRFSFCPAKVSSKLLAVTDVLRVCSSLHPRGTVCRVAEPALCLSIC